MKNRKGFTLIELLAVIVVLAIVAIIVIPMVADLISSSKKAADKQSASNYGRAIQNAIATCLAKGTEISDATYDINNITNDCLNSSIEINGKKPTSGNFTIAKGEFADYEFTINDYVYRMNGVVEPICPVLAGTANESDVLVGKTFYKTDGKVKLTGTLEVCPTLTGDATASDVASGKTFYSNDGKTQLTGTAPVSIFPAGYVFKSTALGNTFPGFGDNVIPITLDVSSSAYRYHPNVTFNTIDTSGSSALNGKTSSSTYTKASQGMDRGSLEIWGNATAYSVFLPYFYNFDYTAIQNAVKSGTVTCWLEKVN